MCRNALFKQLVRDQWSVTLFGGGKNTVLQQETLRWQRDKMLLHGHGLDSRSGRSFFGNRLGVAEYSMSSMAVKINSSNSALTRALSVAVESDYVSDYETDVYYSEDDNLDKTVFCK